MAVDLWYSMEDLDAIVGDGCSVVCQPVSLLAASWGIPFVSWGCSSSSLSDKKIYPTFSRVESTWFSLAPIFSALVKVFNWKHVAIVTTSEDVFKSTADVIRDDMVRNGNNIIFRVVDSTVTGKNINTETLQSLYEIFMELKSKVYIFILLSYPADMRNMLITALDAGMMNGQFAFLTLEYGIEIGLHTYRAELGEYYSIYSDKVM